MFWVGSAMRWICILDDYGYTVGVESMKAILVIDMPEYCVNKCPCEYDYICCKASDRELDYPTADKCRPDWCKLRPLPSPDGIVHETEYQQGFYDGFCYCLDKIREQGDI